MTRSTTPVSALAARRRSRCRGGVLALALLLVGCAGGTPHLLPLRPKSLVWPVGTRVMVAAVVENPFTVRLVPLDPPPALAPNLRRVAPPAIQRLSVRALLDALRDGRQADRLLLVRPVTSVLRHYGSYPEIIGFDTHPVPIGSSGGQALFDVRSEPVYVMRHRFTCRWTSYIVECYDGQGIPLGRKGVARVRAPSCPPSADADILNDDREALYRWLRHGPRTP